MMSYQSGYAMTKLGCDEKDTVGAMSDTVSVMSCLKWMGHHKNGGLV